LKNAYRDGDMKAHRKEVDGAALVEVLQAAAGLIGQTLKPEYLSMSSRKREHARGQA
jgi:hypothetical protein